ncbi:N-acetylmuramic acid 6-phosphate etherase [Acetobacter indonesiensis]|uniref:N-acetylmuramic acid 6-phosphate etherase n=1 Tax=Acetobacter indonesiensis TaxID=104101 RepID=UPI001F3D2D0F|nr:N-acetylmuramic acid 6-phosphate etherase [Acetobacter indonesiensis]MCG0995096.1 N-acetylmuramic acid 6-phosphate etherase [Acetobacter indonesiensis]
MTTQSSSAASSPAKTETYDSRYEALDVWPTGTMLEALLESQLSAVSAVKAALPGMEAAITAALPRLQRGGRLFYVGAGTSGRIGLQDGVELIPTYGWPEDRLVLLLAGGDAALFQPVEGAEDDEDAARAAITQHKAGPDDVVIGVAASGGTPYTCAALTCARQAGSLTIGLSCSPETRLLRDAELGLLIETGSEVVAGSTRMKAGTAQKVALNMLSTALMVRLGHTWRGQMVDMRIVNAKLVKRAHRMVQQLTDCTPAEAITALEKAEGSIKLAVLVCFGYAPEEGRAVLANNGGNLRTILADTLR